MQQLVLAGDIGGTKTAMGCFTVDGGPAQPVHEHVYRTNDWTSFRAIIADFLGRIDGRPEAACFGIAGPIANRRAEITVNVHWPIDARDIADLFGHDRIDLINDVQAMALGTLTLPDSGLETIHPGEPEPTANRGLIAAGTGLGLSLLVHNRGRWIAVPSEAGHVNFAPNSEIEIDLLATCGTSTAAAAPSASCPGPGLYHIYKFLRDTGRGTEPEWLARENGSGDPARRLQVRPRRRGAALRAGAGPVVQIYGAVAGDYAITTVARGGVYLGGAFRPRPAASQARRVHAGIHGQGPSERPDPPDPGQGHHRDKTPLYGAAAHAIRCWRSRRGRVPCPGSRCPALFRVATRHKEKRERRANAPPPPFQCRTRYLPWAQALAAALNSPNQSLAVGPKS